MKVTINLLLLPFLPAVLAEGQSDTEPPLGRIGLSESGHQRSRGLKTSKSQKSTKNSKKEKFEVWASDQSNSVKDQPSLGVKGSYLWIYDSDGVEDQLAGKGNVIPLSCSPGKSIGPCDAFDVFPQTLQQFGSDGATGDTLNDLEGFGRLHGMVADPQNLYVNANFFTPGGAYIGIIDVKTKDAVSLFRLTKFATQKGRSVHMSFWLKDGSAIICTNLHGKAIERINIHRHENGKIFAAEFDRGGTFGLGTYNTVEEEATVFKGPNAFGRQLIGKLVGEYSDVALGDLTPNGYCKEDGCQGSEQPDTGRTGNVPICPIPSNNDNIYVNFGGGGMLILNPRPTPMTIVGEYDRVTFNGAGCGGTQVGEQMFMNAGISAGGSGHDQSTFTVYSFDDGAYDNGPNPINTPPPVVVYRDPNNTNTIGNIDGVDSPNDTGQLPGITTCRDAHGIIDTFDQQYIHQFDRIQNKVEVFDVETYQQFSYDLTSKNGRSGRDPENAGPCMAKSVSDDPNLIPNNPSPDLLGKSPDGKYIFVGLRGPAPVSVAHSAQGSCPGVGIVKISQNGKRGKLVDVIRTTNVVDTSPLPPIVGGTHYTGAERSDVHSAIVVSIS